MHQIVAVIPARIGSTRLPGKPLIDLCGKPMIQHVYERTVGSKMVEWCLVATDDERIAQCVRAFGGHAVMTPENLQTGTDRVAFVARSLPDAEIIVNVQGDEPLLVPEMVDQAVRLLVDDAEANIGTLVRVIDDEADLQNPAIVKVALDSRRNCLYFSRSPIPFSRNNEKQSLLSTHQYFKHIGLYVYRRPFLIRLSEMQRTPLEMTEELEQLRVLEHGQRIVAANTIHDSHPVDTPEDVESIRKRMEVTNE